MFIPRSPFSSFPVSRLRFACALAAFALIAAPRSYAMHITEGFLPPFWCLFWTALYLPFFIRGLGVIKRAVAENPRAKLLLAMAAAFCFVLSALKIPSVTGSSSHPTGVGLGVVLFGPSVMSVLGLIVLTFQALLLAHGGLTTLGANAFSMAAAGPLIGYAFYRLSSRFIKSKPVAVFLAAFWADLSTYVITSIELGAVFNSGDLASGVLKFMGIFAVTQIPLAIIEALVTVVVFNTLSSLCKEDLQSLRALGRSPQEVSR
ncbi:MAG: energy-coupling factor ABC transporter permease [Spirochaetaceae bacterium]|nr:energy-coupling factor ABC transporter permease [Spirochaetaceae bacterium]